LVRHGHAIVAERGIVGGHRGCRGLSEQGRRQTEALKDRMVATALSADAIVSSVLPRAVETAEILAKGIGIQFDGIPQYCDLCERHPGEGDGLTWDAFISRYGAFDPLVEPDRPLSPGGETYNAFLRRASSAIERLADDHRDQTVLVVTHGGVILASILTLLGLTPSWVTTEVVNTSMTEWVRDETGRWLLARFNDAAHLEVRRTLS
jgi:probable phosphoglycerate mutase